LALSRQGVVSVDGWIQRRWCGAGFQIAAAPRRSQRARRGADIGKGKGRVSGDVKIGLNPLIPNRVHKPAG